MSDTLIFSQTSYDIRNPKVDVMETIQVGQVWRMDAMGEFADFVVLGMSDPAKHPKFHEPCAYVRLARPYAYASCVGTTGPGVLLGSEQITVTAKRLLESFTCVGGRTHGGYRT
jgi:hypothetical protein